MRPCFDSSSVPSSPTVTTHHSLQSSNSSFQPAYFHSSAHYDISKRKSMEPPNVAHDRSYICQNVNPTNSSSLQRIANSQIHHLTHYPQSPIQTTTPYSAYECYRNSFSHSQPNITGDSSNVGNASEFDPTKNYIVHETRLSSTQSSTNDIDGASHYSNRSAIINVQSQIPHRQFRDANVNQTTKRPRPPPPPPPPRSGSWIGKTTVSTPIDDSTNQHCIKYNRESSCSQMKVVTSSTDPITVDYSTQQQPRIYQMHSSIGHTNTHPPSPNVFTISSTHPNNNVQNHTSGPSCLSDSSYTGIAIAKHSMQHHQQEQQKGPQQQYQRQNTRISASGQQLLAMNSPTQYQPSDSVPSWCRSNHVSDNDNYEHQLQYPSKQLIVNSRKEVIEALLSLLIWHHPEANFTENMNQSEIHAFHTFLSNWLASSDSNCLSNNQLHSPTATPSPTSMYVAQCTRRILTHLIRILYSDTVYDEEVSTNQSGREIEEEDYTMNALIGESGESNHGDNHYLSYSAPCNSNNGGGIISNQSSDEDNNHLITDGSTVQQSNYANMSINNSDNNKTADNNFSRLMLTNSKILPPNTSLIELKAAALEAIHKLAPLCQPEPKLYGRDMGIIQLLTAIHSYSLSLNERITQVNMSNNNNNSNTNENVEKTVMNSLDRRTNNIMSVAESCISCPVAEVAALVRLSFDSMHRNAICELGGVHALISLLRIEQTIWSKQSNPYSNNNPNANNDGNHSTSLIMGNQNFTTLLENSLALRRYICMALTNLTYAAAENKAFICRRLANLEALLAQLETGNEELKQVSASVLRNLSWRTDSRSKAALRRVCAAKRLTVAAMTAQRESTLRTTLSALWNLSAHCSQNKRAVCSVDGVFPFLLRMLRLQNPVQNLVIIENSGGILRNISTIIASRDDYRSILHQYNCYSILLELLRNPPSLTVVVNVCGTLWNLTCSSSINANGNVENNIYSNNLLVSSHNDRLILLHLGALDLIQSLTQSKHDLIRSSSMAVYRNLIQTDASTNQNHLLPRNRGLHHVNSNHDPPSNEFTGTQNQIVSNARDQPSDLYSRSHVNTASGENSTKESDSSCTLETSSQSTAEQTTCKRRVSSSRTSRLRFGLLSVVFEAESDDEMEDDDEDEDEDDEG
ncbi:unnamed protein product, partial [Heterobilharzia americana]